MEQSALSRLGHFLEPTFGFVTCRKILVCVPELFCGLPASASPLLRDEKHYMILGEVDRQASQIHRFFRHIQSQSSDQSLLCPSFGGS